MSKKDEILKCILDEMLTEEILEKLNITDEELKKYTWKLKRDGHHLVRLFNYDGTQRYAIQKSPSYLTHILDVPETGIFRALGVSDYHIGSRKENLKYINMVYNYARQNDIHIIFNCGDLIEGMMNYSYHDSYYEQISHLLDEHPFDDRILNFIIFGNHDEDLIKNTGLDFQTILGEKRTDLIPLGYGIQKIGIGNENIVLCHRAQKVKNVYAKLILTGHGHKTKFISDGKSITLCLPTVSNDVKQGFPAGFIDISLTMNDGFFDKGKFIQYMFLKNQIIPTSENVHNFTPETSQKRLILK